MFNLKNQQEVYNSLVCTDFFWGMLPLDANTFNEIQKSYDTVSTITVCNPNGFQTLHAFVILLRVICKVEIGESNVFYDCEVAIGRC